MGTRHTDGWRAARHFRTGSLWIGLYLLLSLLPILFVLAGPKPPGRDFLTELSVGIAFMALAMICPRGTSMPSASIWSEKEREMRNRWSTIAAIAIGMVLFFASVIFAFIRSV